jgi:hypothetical protein
MAAGYTVFFSYLLESDSGNTTGFGYSTAIHCNYINQIYLDNITNKEVNIYFNDVDDFKFLSTTGDTGYTINKIYILVQLINNSLYSNLSDVKPTSNEWKKYDVTTQISGYTSGQLLSAIDLSSVVFKVPLYLYYNETLMPTYDLSYLNYPLVSQTGTTALDTPLCFGDEQYFIGNVTTDIQAVAYTTDLVINLPINEFNSSTNESWDQDKVYITEIGLYDSNKNLVAIGKLNNPLPKDSTISRTIVFGIDF